MTIVPAGSLEGGSDAVGPIEWALREIHAAADLDALLAAEAQAASVYWDAWAPLPILFTPRDSPRVPDHWTVFGQRASLIAGGPRAASNPGNALANYCYALLEAETILACHAVGLDPSVGIFHTDQPDRASLVLDIMEAARHTVDAYLLRLLTERMLSARDFVETDRAGAESRRD